MRKYCFVGPSLDPEEAARLVPDTTVLPPIAHGDLFRLDLEAGDMVIIIDGYYYQRLPIRHKEILDCLASGVVVMGASSMGALRAAEMAPYGMLGTGLIYQLYVNETIEGDDEVAVLHASEAEGFAILGEALINIRATLRRGLRKKVLDEPTAALMLDCAANTVFYRRTYDAIATSATASGGDKQRISDFLEQLPSLRIDVKRRDAIHALKMSAAFAPAVPSQMPPRIRTLHFLEWQRQHRIDPVHKIDDASVSAVLRTMSDQYPNFLVDVMSRWLAAETVNLVGADQELVESFRTTNAIDEMSPWLRSHNLTYEELSAYLRVQSACTKMSDEEITEHVLMFGEQLGIGRVSLNHSGAENWLTAAERAQLSEKEAARRAITRSFRVGRALSVPDPVLIEAKISGTYDDAAKQAAEIKEFNSRLKERRPDHDVIRLRGPVITSWFLNRWNAVADERGALAQRGLRNSAELVDAARWIFLYDKATAGTKQLTLGRASKRPQEATSR